MKKTYSYEECYKILGLKPGCSRNDIRTSYKRLIQKWHPDRFEEKSAEKTVAEEKIKHINIAHQHLSTYFLKNKTLPLATPVRENFKRQNTHTVNAAKIRKNKNDNVNKDPGRSDFNKKRQLTNKRPVLKIAIFIIALSGFYYIQSTGYFAISTDITPLEEANSTVDPDNEQIDSSPDNEPSPDFSSHNENNSATNALPGPYFTLGSSMGEVAAIQGTPTFTKDDIWYYGESEVHFKEGKVTKWIRSNDTPLRSRIQTNYNTPRH